VYVDGLAAGVNIENGEIGAGSFAQRQPLTDKLIEQYDSSPEQIVLRLMPGLAQHCRRLHQCVTNLHGFLQLERRDNDQAAIQREPARSAAKRTGDGRRSPARPRPAASNAPKNNPPK
jgi:hypothetical protein